MDAYPQLVVSAATLLLIILAIETGFRVGRATHAKSEAEKESPVSAIAGTILALLAFMMAFTFSVVSDRYDARKALVRQEANAVRTAWLRSDFLPEPDRREATGLLAVYVDHRVAAVQANDVAQVTRMNAEAVRLQRRLWDMAVANARKDMNSDVAALYIESLNEADRRCELDRADASHGRAISFSVARSAHRGSRARAPSATSNRRARPRSSPGTSSIPAREADPLLPCASATASNSWCR